MFILGLLSILQITFLPGILILKFFSLKKGFIQTIVLAFGVSLIANHLFVFLITAIGLNITYSFYGLFGLELIALYLLYASSLRESLETITALEKERIREFITSLRIFSKEEDQTGFGQTLADLFSIVFIVMALSSIWWAFKVWYTNLDTVFTQWDTIVSWNSWAGQWFSGQFPTNTNRYAQLIPTNFAVSYAFLGTTQIQFFAKSFMPLFNLYILLLMFDLGLEHKKPAYFIGVVASRYILKKFLGNYIASGYVDVALAFFTFLTVYTLLKAVAIDDTRQQNHYLGLGFIFAAGTALTKQNGLFVFVLYPLLAYALILKNNTNLNNQQRFTILSKWLILSLVIILPWYAFNEYRIFQGSVDPNVSYLIGGRHEGRNLIERFTRAVGMLEKYAFLYPLILVLLPFIEGPIIWIVLTLLIPYSMIWALGFSTFHRNLSIALPILGLATGFSLQKITEIGAKIIEKIRIGKLQSFFLVVLLIVIAIGAGQFLSDEVLVQNQEELQKDILLGYVNKQIYAYFEEIGHFEPIMTNYPIRFLPGMEDLQIDIDNFSNYNVYQRVIDNHPDVNLMLIFEDRADERVLEEISENIESGNFELIFEDGKYSFVKIINR